MKAWLRQVRRRLAEPIPVTRGMLHAFGLSIGVTFALAIGGMTYALLEVADEAQQRSTSDRRSQADIERIVERVVRVEGVRTLARRLERACRRFPSCAAELERAERRDARRQVGRERRERRDHGDQAPDQLADRPPRAPSNPPTVPQPDTGGGGDPPDGGAGTPAPTDPSSPSASPIVQVDPPPIDIDGPNGLIPDVLNLPRVDVPPLRLP